MLHFTVDALALHGMSSMALWLTAIVVTTTFVVRTDAAGWVANRFTPPAFAEACQFDYDAATRQWFVPDCGAHTILRMSTSGEVTAFAGQSRNAGFSSGATALFDRPVTVVVSTVGELWILESNNNAVRV